MSPSTKSGEYGSLGLSILFAPVPLSGRGVGAQGIRGEGTPILLMQVVLG